MAAVDVADFLLQAYNDGHIQTVADIATVLAAYPEEVARGLHFLGEKGYDAIRHADLSALGEVVYALTPFPAGLSLMDNISEALGTPSIAEIVLGKPSIDVWTEGGSEDEQSWLDKTPFGDAATAVADAGKSIVNSAKTLFNGVASVQIPPWRW
jgi:hypothetical protein